jgi:hypothetical protein
VWLWRSPGGRPRTSASSLPSPADTSRSRRESFWLGIVLSRLFLKEAHRLCSIRPGMQRRSLQARKPALVLETHSPLWMALGEPDQPVSSPFFRAYWGSGLSIQRFVHAPSRESVARMVSPLTSSLVSPSSKLTSAASLSVQSLLCLPNSLGERCNNSRRESAQPPPPRRPRGPLWDARSLL